MKKKRSLAILMTSLIGAFVRAEDSQVSAFQIESAKRENLFRASGLIDQYVASNLNHEYRIKIDSKTNSASVLMKAPKSATMEELLNQIKNEFGSSIQIKKMDLNQISLGTQDTWMGK